MTGFLLAIASVLLVSLIAGMIRVVRGPDNADRMLAAQLFGTTGVAVVMLLSAAMNRVDLLDVALVFALLGAVFGVAFVGRSLTDESASEGER